MRWLLNVAVLVFIQSLIQHHSISIEFKSGELSVGHSTVPFGRYNTVN